MSSTQTPEIKQARGRKSKNVTIVAPESIPEKITIEEKEPTTEKITIEEKEPPTDSITETITEPITEPVKIEADEEEDEDDKEARLQCEALIQQMAIIKRKNAEKQAQKNIMPKRDAMIQQIEQEKQISEQKINVIRQKIDELNKSVDDIEKMIIMCDIKIKSVRNGEMDAEIVANSGAIVEEKTKTTMSVINQKTDVNVNVERRGRERECAQSPRHTTTQKKERPRSKSPNLDGGRKIAPLEYMLQQPTEFKYYVYNPGVWCYAKTRRGDNIVYELDGEPHASKKLSGWIDTLEKHYNNGVNHRKIGVYDKKKEGPQYLHTQTNKWRRMADDVDENTLVLNPK